MSASFQTDQVPGHEPRRQLHGLPEATVTQDSPGLAAQLQPDQDLQPEDLLRRQGQLLRGHLLPRPRGRVRRLRPLSTYDDNMLHDSAGYFYYADRARFGTNASLTHYAEDFIAGSHDFKFGAEFERSIARSRYGYTGTGGALGDNVKYYDYYGYGYHGALPGLPVRGLRHQHPLHPARGLRPGFLAGHEAAEHQPRPPLQPELGRRQGRQRHRLQDEPARPPPRLHLRHPRRQDDRPQGPLRPVHRSHADRLPRPDEPVGELQRLHRLLLGPRREEWVEMFRDRPRDPTRWTPTSSTPT